MSEKRLISITLASGQVINGVVRSEIQLVSRFQIWASSIGVTERESLAMFCYDSLDAQNKYFKTPDTANRFGLTGFEKIDGVDIPYLTEELIQKIHKDKQSQQRKG